MSSINALTILQYDWDDVLWKLEGEVWINYKVKDEKSIQGKLRCIQISTKGLPNITGTNGFTVESVGKDHIQVKYKDAPFSTMFIAASKVYSGIHKKGITSLSVSHKGLSVSVCKDNQLLVWDFNHGELKCTLLGHVGDVYKCKFFPSGVVVLSGGADMQLKIWCALTGQCPVTLTGHTMAITDFDFIDRGKNFLSVSKDGTARLWSSGSACCVANIVKLSSTINCCHVFSDPSFISVGEPPEPPSEEEVGTKDKAVLLGCEDGSVHCVAIYSRKKLFSFNCSSAVNSLTTLSNSQFVVGCHSGEIFLFNIKDTSAPVKTWFESNSAVLCVVRFKEEGFFSCHADGLTIYRHIKQDDKRVILTGPNCDPVYDVCTNFFVYTCSRDALIRRYNVDKIIQQFFSK